MSRFSLILGVFLIPIVLNPWAGNEAYETTKQSFFLAFLALAGLLALSSFLTQKNLSLKWNRPLFILSCLWLFSFAISTLLSIAPIESFWGSYDRRQGFFTIILLGLLFWICLQLFQHEKHRRAFFTIILFAGAIVALYGIAQALKFDPLRKNVKDMFIGRSFATMGSPVFLGQFLIFPWAMAFFYLMRKERVRLYGILLLLFSAGLYVTLNRASFLGLAAMIGVFFASKILWNRRKIFAVVFMTLAAFAIGSFWLQYEKNSVPLLSTRSLGSRAVLYEAAIKAIPSHFFFGSGPETAYQTIQKTLSPGLYRYERMLDIPDRAHNVFLDTLLTRGVFGFLILLGTAFWMLGLAIQKGLKNIYSEAAFFSLIAYFLSIQLSFSVITHGVFIVGMSALFFSQSLKFKTVQIPKNFLFKTLYSAVLIAAIFLFANFSYKIIKTEWLLGRAVHSYLFVKPDALDLFQKTHRELPYYREIPYMIHSLFLEDAKKNQVVAEALTENQKEMERITGRSFYSYLMIGQIAPREHRDAAFARAAKLAPHWPGVWYKWGKTARKQGDFKTAREKFEKFLSFVPKFSPEEKEQERIWRISNPTPFEVEAALKTLSLEPASR